MDEYILHVKLWAASDFKQMFKCMEKIIAYGNLIFDCVQKKIYVNSISRYKDVYTNFTLQGDDIEYIYCKQEKLKCSTNMTELKKRFFYLNNKKPLIISINKSTPDILCIDQEEVSIEYKFFDFPLEEIPNVDIEFDHRIEIDASVFSKISRCFFDDHIDHVWINLTPQHLKFCGWVNRRLLTNIRFELKHENKDPVVKSSSNVFISNNLKIVGDYVYLSNNINIYWKNNGCMGVVINFGTIGSIRFLIKPYTVKIQSADSLIQQCYIKLLTIYNKQQLDNILHSKFGGIPNQLVYEHSKSGY